MWWQLLNIWGLGRDLPPWSHPYGLQHDTRATGPKDGGAAPWQILDVHLFRRFLLTHKEFGHETSAIGKCVSLAFHPYVERPKRTPYVAGATKTSRTAPEL